jgi:hypothetical protein
LTAGRGGKGGLLGGSSKPTSKLANLAKSSRGTFGKRGLRTDETGKLTSVSRLSTLTSAGRRIPVQESSDIASGSTVELPVERKDSPATVAVPASPPTEPRRDLLSPPSSLACSLFQVILPQEHKTDFLCRIYADFYPLTDVQTAFATASPDDVVRNAQRGTRRITPVGFGCDFRAGDGRGCAIYDGGGESYFGGGAGNETPRDETKTSR